MVFTRMVDLLGRSFSGSMTWWWWMAVATLLVAAVWWWYTASTPIRAKPKNKGDDDDLST